MRRVTGAQSFEDKRGAILDNCRMEIIGTVGREQGGLGWYSDQVLVLYGDGRCMMLECLWS